jgi:hypothetical protein
MRQTSQRLLRLKKAIFMTIMATDAIYIAETDNATNLLNKTAADVAEAD